MGADVNRLIDTLQASLGETLKALSVLSEAELDAPSEHPCAMGGTVRDLLTHNIDHERMHAGQVYSARYSLKKMQKDQVDRLMTETLRARVELMASLMGLPDEALDARTPDDQWTIREMIEHTLYWERHSIDDLARTQLRGRVPSNGAHPGLALKDPIYGALPTVNRDDTSLPG
jgi:uncharacterized damage-inducible protein DinB